MMGLASTILQGLLSTAVSSGAPEAPKPPPQPPVLTGSLDAGIYAGRQPDQDAVVVSPLLQLGVRARPEVELGFSMGVASLTAQHQRQGRVRAQGPGNFVFGTRWVRDAVGERHHGHLGFAFALPTTLQPSAQLVEAHRLARASRGGLDPWQWAPATMAVLLPAGWSMHVRRLEVGVDGALGGMFSAAGDLDEPGFAGQLRGHASMRLGRVQLGGALAAVYNGRDELGALQTSAQPFVGVALCARDRIATCGVHLDGRASINIDAPYGYGPQGRRIWGTQFGLRWALRDADDGR